MNRKILMILLIIITLTSLSAAYASENATDDCELRATENNDVLEETLVPAQNGNVVTHDVVKYYGDKETKFKVEVYDKDNNPKPGVSVEVGRVIGKTIEKTTNSKGIAMFPINYKVGKHTVETRIYDEGGVGYPLYDNTVKIKSTIKSKTLVKFSGEKKKFKIQFLDSKGKKLVKKIVKIKIKGKTHKLRTDKNGYVKIKSNFKVGKSKIEVTNPKSGEKRNLSVVVLKKGVHKANVKIVENAESSPSTKLKNGDKVTTLYETGSDIKSPAVHVMASYGNSPTRAHHTKLLKAKIFFKNKNTGKIITKTSKKVKDKTIKVKPIKGYTPFKVTVWYRDIR